MGEGAEPVLAGATEERKNAAVVRVACMSVFLKRCNAVDVLMITIRNYFASGF